MNDGVFRMFVATVILTSAALPISVGAQPSKGEFAGNFTFENDLFFNTDRYYTDGVQIEVKRRWTDASEDPGKPLTSACKYLGCEGQSLYVSHYKFGQLMYTPQRLSVHEPQPDDRPWAGMLYYAQDASFLSNDGSVLTTISGEIGITGRYSYAEQTQKWIHRTFSGTAPRGWSNQIGGEIGLMATVERRSAVAELSYAPSSDGTQLRATSHWRVAVGNIMTFAGAGLTFVVGKNLPLVADRGPGLDTKDAPVRNQVINTLDSAAVPSRSCLFEWLECSASASIEARLMARNVFLDGTLFRDGASVESRLLVVDASLTGRLDFPRTRSSLTGPWFAQFRATRRSPEFKSAKPVHSQSFGALTIGTEF